MTKEVEMSTKYDPSQVEPGRYKEWIEKGLFKPNEDKEAKPYSIVIPPPNVTGKPKRNKLESTKTIQLS